MTANNNKPTVFISYSHKDEEWKDKLVTHLGVLQEQGLLEIWDDRQITGGDDWFPEIEKAINKAQIAVLMISANFLTSKFILGKEVPDLLKKREKDNLRIMPLIVKPCAWETVKWLNPIQARPKDGRPLSGGNDFQIDKDLSDFAKEIYELLKRVPKQQLTTDDEPIFIPPRKIEISKLPVISAELFGRDKELEILDNAWEDTHTRVISFVAWGGVGKSALINAWLNKMAEQNYKGAELVYGWSFYSQGTKEKGQASADGFINDAFKYFGYKGEIPKSLHERGRLLAEIISRQKTLLILDGLEPLQYPPGQMHGFLKDKTMPGLLKNLVRNINGLCIITSRCKVEDLKATEGKLSRTHELEHLSDQAGIAILKSYDLKGKEKEFKQTSKEFKGHALALHLVGSYLKTFHGGDIKQRREIPKLTLEEKQGGHARRVMESYEKWFAESNKAELDVLNILGLFDRPAEKEAIDVLRTEPAIPGLTDRLQNISNHNWQKTLNHLRELHLIARQDEHDPDTLDCHPLIREHFGEKLQQQNPEAWKEAHGRLYEYYKNLPEKELPDTLEEMEPLFAAVMHGCLAGKHLKALYDVYWYRISRVNQGFLHTRLGSYGSLIACLSNFFERLWDKPASDLTEHEKATVLNWAGFALRAVGRLSEAAQLMKSGLEMNIKQKNITESAKITSNLSGLYLAIGDVSKAKEYGRQSVTFADISEDGFHMLSKRTTYACALHQAGKNKTSEKLFIEAENMQQKRQPEYPFLYSLWGFRFCDLLLSLGKYHETLEKAKKMLELDEVDEEGWILDIALDKLTIGKALMLQAVENTSSGFAEAPVLSTSTSLSTSLAEAEDYLNQAVDGLREAGTQHHIPRGLFARATLFRHKEEFLKSWADLDEAREIAEYGQMKLHLTDFHLEACRNIKKQLSEDRRQKSGDSFVIIEDGETINLSAEQMQDRFQKHFKEAQRLVQETGYHRRDGELRELRIKAC